MVLTFRHGNKLTSHDIQLPTNEVFYTTKQANYKTGHRKRNMIENTVTDQKSSSITSRTQKKEKTLRLHMHEIGLLLKVLCRWISYWAVYRWQSF